VADEPAFAWTIGDAARRAGVSPGTIRLWEQQGLIQPSRSRGGIRLFDTAQVRRIERIAYLRSVDKLNLAAIKSVLSSEPAPANGSEKERGDEQAPPAEAAEPRQLGSYGKHLRRLRRERGLTLAEVAKGVDLSISFVSALEREEAGASVKTLQRILRFYGTTEHAMLTVDRPQSIGAISRRGEREAVHDPFSRVTTQALVPAHANIGASLSNVEPGGGSHGSYTHEGEEMMYVLAGTVKVTLQESEVHRLEAGDSLYFASTAEHAWENDGDVTATVMWVNTPPSF
jgi:DNA-binding transcriptional MerR regulator/quercetin dioxygenase-like cupin family protein